MIISTTYAPKKIDGQSDPFDKNRPRPLNARSELLSPQKLIEICEVIIISRPYSQYDNIGFKNKKVINVWSN